MSSKVKNIIFYILAGLFVVIALAGLVICAVSGELPIWLAIVLAVVEVGLFVSGTILNVKLLNNSTVETKPYDPDAEDYDDADGGDVKNTKGTAKKQTETKEVK